MSQIGYMFLALGVQALDAAIFNLLPEGFLLSLMYVVSGSVIVAWLD